MVIWNRASRHGKEKQSKSFPLSLVGGMWFCDGMYEDASKTPILAQSGEGSILGQNCMMLFMLTLESLCI